MASGKKEQFLGNGKVKVDGKEMWIADLERYRSGSSNRERSRVRGGTQVRRKASWSVVEVFCVVWHDLVGLACIQGDSAGASAGEGSGGMPLINLYKVFSLCLSCWTVWVSAHVHAYSATCV